MKLMKNKLESIPSYEKIICVCSNSLLIGNISYHILVIASNVSLIVSVSPGQFSCRKNISRLAVCDTDQKEITIDETYCWSVDQLGRPIDIYSDVDYRMQVGGGWWVTLDNIANLVSVVSVWGIGRRI